jgi:transposase
MKVATKFVSALTTAQQEQLKQLAADDPARRVRMRAHSLLLSAEGLSIDEIARVYQVHRNSVSSWIDHWHQQGVAGLSDKPRPGGPTKLNAAEQDLARQLLQDHPHAPKTVLALLLEHTGKTISSSTLTRLAKAADLRWKRVRKSLKGKRDQAAFTQAKKEIEQLKKTQSRSMISARRVFIAFRYLRIIVTDFQPPSPWGHIGRFVGT